MYNLKPSNLERNKFQVLLLQPLAQHFCKLLLLLLVKSVLSVHEEISLKFLCFFSALLSLILLQLLV
jgi:hypothetical protein